MSRIFNMKIDTEALTGARLEFETDPPPSRNERPVIHEPHEFNPEIVDVLECMVIDDAEERADVAEYIEAIFPSAIAS